jgi:isocitrate/isopropylmalate dehydrogenase
MLEYLGWKAEAAAIEAAVEQSVVSGNGTAEIGGKLGTRETGDYVAAAITARRH